MKSDRPWMMAPAGRLIPNVTTLIYLNFMCVPSVSYFSLGDTACQIWKTVDVLFIPNCDLYSRVSTFLRCLWRRTCKVNCFFCFIVEAIFQVCIDFRRTRIFTTVKWRGRNDSIVVAWSSGFYSFTITHLLWQMFFLLCFRVILFVLPSACRQRTRDFDADELKDTTFFTRRAQVSQSYYFVNDD